MTEQDIQLLNDVLASDKFDDAEKAIVKARFEKGEKTDEIYKKIAGSVPLSAEFMAGLEELEQVMGHYCEHDRPYVTSCAECFNLEKKIAHLHPEWFKDDPECTDLFEDDQLN